MLHLRGLRTTCHGRHVRKLHAMSESDLLRSIMERLALIPGLVYWRNNTGIARTGGRYIAYGHVGSGDIIGLLPGGRFFSLELKTPENRKGPTPEQIAFGEAVSLAGGLYAVVRSVEEAVIRIQEALP